MVASAGWESGWVGGQNVALGWRQAMLGICNVAASTQSPAAAPGYGVGLWKSSSAKGKRHRETGSCWGCGGSELSDGRCQGGVQ